MSKRILALRAAQDDFHDGDGVDVCLDDGRVEGFFGQLPANGGYLALHLDSGLVAVYTLFEGYDHDADPFLGDGKELVNA